MIYMTRVYDSLRGMLLPHRRADIGRAAMKTGGAGFDRYDRAALVILYSSTAMGDRHAMG